MSLPKRKLGPLSVSAVALGCMHMSEFYGPADHDKGQITISKAFEMGVTHFDTADMYGVGRNEQLVGGAIKSFRDQIILSTKCGFMRKEDDPSWQPLNGRPEYVKAACDASLQRLGLDYIDLYYLHRVDPETPIEESVGAMADLVKEGKVRYLGLSEVSADELRRAHAVHPIAAVQSEYSLWHRQPEEEVFPTCDELGVGFVAFSPVGRGFLSGRFSSLEDFGEGDRRPDFCPEMNVDNLAHNRAVVNKIEAIAAEKGCTAAQLALAWVLANPIGVVPLFGTTNIGHLEDNIASLQVTLSPTECAELNQISGQFAKN